MEQRLLIGARGRRALAILCAALVVVATAPQANAAKYRRIYWNSRIPQVSTPVRTTPVTTAPVTPAPAPVTPAPVTPAPVVDSAPLIAGTPKTSAKAGEAYSFVPTASDANGDKLAFTIANRPSWLSFSTTTGALTGTPTEAQVGQYNNVTIQVGANGKYATLPAFSVNVVSVGPRGITLSWTPPTQNEDGSALKDLKGYNIRYGTTSGTYTSTVSVNNAGLTTYFVENLVPGKYYFVISSFNSKGVESNFSNEAAKTI